MVTQFFSRVCTWNVLDALQVISGGQFSLCWGQSQSLLLLLMLLRKKRKDRVDGMLSLQHIVCIFKKKYPELWPSYYLVAGETGVLGKPKDCFSNVLRCVS